MAAYEDPEGIYIQSEDTYTINPIVDQIPVVIPRLTTRYYKWGFGFAHGINVYSYNEIEIYDLISSGSVHGPVSGYYQYSGNEGEVGWRTSSFTAFSSPSGLSNSQYLRSIYFNEIPIIDSDGKYNFSSFNVSISKGTENGYLLQDDTSSNELTVTRPIGERLRGASSDAESRSFPYEDDYTKVYRVSNNDVSSCYVDVRVPALYRQVVGQTLDIYAEEINYSIYYRAIFSNPSKTKEFELAVEEKIKGNTKQEYVRRSRIYFDKITDNDFVAWEIKIIRETPDSISSYVENKTFIDSITEVYENKFLYPKCSVARCKFSAKEFNGIPSRYYHMRMRKIKVPNNYDPELRSYGDSTLATTTGNQGEDYWNGEFKAAKEYSNNPAWVLYDIMTDKLDGLGRNVSEDDMSASKWDLYQIAKNCDTLVSDGEGGLEPRFTCNTYLSSKEEAYKVVNDLSSVFNGIPYYQGGSIFFAQDRYKGDPVYTFTNANVEDGNFSYFSTSKKNRYTVAVVRYNDKKNYYRPNFEYVEDTDGIKRYGIQEIELTSFATTSRGQAVRAGRWALESSKLKEQVNFIAGIEAQTMRIGDLFQVHDSNRKGFYEGGRILNCFTTGTGLAIDLDRDISLSSGKNYEFKVLGSTFRYDPILVDVESSNDYSNIKRTYLQSSSIDSSYVSSLSDGRSRILFPSSGVFDFTGYDLFTNKNIWTINLASGEDNTNESIGLRSDQYSYYTCVNIAESEKNKYEIIGLEYNEDKFDAISSNIVPDYSETVTSKILNGPNNLSLTFTEENYEIYYEFDGIVSDLLSSYEVYIKKGSDPDPSSDNATFFLSKSENSGYFYPTSSGTYYFRVYSVSTSGTRSSSYASSSIAITLISNIENTIISSLQIKTPEELAPENDFYNPAGTTLSQEYSVESPNFNWQVGYKRELKRTDNLYRISIREPSNSNTPSNTIYYQETGYQADFFQGELPMYNYSITTNSLYGSLKRNYDIVVEAIDLSTKKTSAGNELDFSISSPYIVSETWSNSDGYDILEANNYPVTGYRLTDGLTGETADYTINTLGSQIATDQWIATDGSIKFTITSGASGLESLPDNMVDMYGAYIYYRSSSFNSGDAYASGTTVGYKEIPLYADTFSFGNVYTADAQLPDTTNEQYVSISIMDRFDYFAIKAGTESHRLSLDMSNTVRIERRGVGAPTGTEYVLLSADPNLQNARVMQAGTGLKLTNDGTNVTLDFDPSSLDYLGSSDTTLTGDEFLLIRGDVPYRKSYGSFDFSSSSTNSETLQIQVPITSSASEGSEWYPRSIVFNNYNETNFVYSYWGKPSGLDTSKNGVIELLFRGSEHDSSNPRYYYDLEIATGIDGSTGFEGSVIVSDFVDTAGTTTSTFFRKRHSISFNSLSDDVSTLYFKLTRIDGVSGQDLTSSGISLSNMFLNYHQLT